MPGIYPQASGNIGALLRLIEEEKKKAPHVRVPAAEPSAPLRRGVAAPLETPIAPESPGTARVVSIRPPVTPAVSPAAPARPVAPRRATMGQIGGPPAVVPPARPIPPAPPQPVAPGVTAAPSAPGIPPAQPQVTPPAAPRPRTLATRISPYVDPYTKYFGEAGPVMKEFVEGTWQPSPPRPPVQRVTSPEVTRALQRSASGGFEKAIAKQKAIDAERKKQWQAPKPTPAPAPTFFQSLAQFLQPITSWLGRLF